VSRGRPEHVGRAGLDRARERGAATVSIACNRAPR
jgi:N-acetylmuramic acid 6-phosphate (MurNAc-6-P) etherase